MHTKIITIPNRYHQELIAQIKSEITYLVCEQSNCYKEKLSVYLAQKTGVTGTYGALVFKKHMGLTITQFYTWVKIERIKVLLESHNITTISRLLHYPSTTYMAKQFKRATGITAGEYKRQLLVDSYPIVGRRQLTTQ